MKTFLFKISSLLSIIFCKYTLAQSFIERNVGLSDCRSNDIVIQFGV